MSRKIKFRVWDGEKMISLSKALRRGLVVVQFNRNDAFEIEPEYEGVRLMHYTGTKDENGIEIYEGDILECRDSYDECNYLTYVRYDAGAPIIDIGGCEYDYTVLGWAIDNGDVGIVEVIGNIYDNPELLEVTDNA